MGNEGVHAHAPAWLRGGVSPCSAGQVMTEGAEAGKRQPFKT